MRRRSLLRGSAAVFAVGLAGCSENSGDPTEAAQTTTRTTNSETTGTTPTSSPDSEPEVAELSAYAEEVSSNQPRIVLEGENLGELSPQNILRMSISGPLSTEQGFDYGIVENTGDQVVIDFGGNYLQPGTNTVQVRTEYGEQEYETISLRVGETWEVDFDSNTPQNWDDGRMITDQQIQENFEYALSFGNNSKSFYDFDELLDNASEEARRLVEEEGFTPSGASLFTTARQAQIQDQYIPGGTQGNIAVSGFYNLMTEEFGRDIEDIASSSGTGVVRGAGGVFTWGYDADEDNFRFIIPAITQDDDPYRQIWDSQAPIGFEVDPIEDDPIDLWASADEIDDQRLAWGPPFYLSKNKQYPTNGLADSMSRKDFQAHIDPRVRVELDIQNRIGLGVEDATEEFMLQVSEDVPYDENTMNRMRNDAPYFFAQGFDRWPGESFDVEWVSDYGEGPEFEATYTG